MSEALKGKVKTDITILGNGGSVDFEYDLNLFNNSAKEYNHDLCRLACQFVTVGYDDLTEDESAEAVSGFPWTQYGLKKVLDEAGFTKQEIQPKADRDEVSYFIASRDVTLESGTFNLIVAAFIGSYKKTWFSNFDPYGVDRVCNDGKGYAGDAEKGIIHLGFADAREYVYAKLTDYIDRHPSEHETKLILIGHSRGAATANLLAAKLIKNGGFENLPLKNENIVTYCYATPNGVAMDKVEILDEYKRIFNYVSPEDFVTVCLPESAGFGKYGTVLKILGDDNRSARNYSEEKAFMQPYFLEAFGMNTYHPFRKGNRAVKKVIDALAKELHTVEDLYEKPLRECFKTVTPYEYFRDTLCAYVAGAETEEEQAAVDRAMKLLIESSVDYVGTSSVYRITSSFFVFKEGVGSVTGNRLLKTNFSESHRPHTYAAYLLSMSEEQLMANTYDSVEDDEEEEEEKE